MAKKKTATKKTAAKKSASKKKTATKTTAAKKAPTKSAKQKKGGKVEKATASKSAPKKGEGGEESESALRNMTTRQKHTPAVFKLPSKKNTPVVFTLEDVREVLRSRRKEKPESEPKEASAPRKSAKKKTAAAESKPTPPPAETPAERRSYGAASLSDILGFNPAQQKEKAFALDEERVPQKWMKYYRLLVELRAHVKEELDEHTKETLKRSAKDDSGDISSFSSHMADNGTDAFDRDFALSLVSNEQEALAEIEGAIQRIYSGSYGICEITGQKIAHERLVAVPFTRFSREGQEEYERTRRRKAQRGGGFLDASPDDSISFNEDDDS